MGFKTDTPFTPANVVTKRYIPCPNCGHLFLADHILPGGVSYKEGGKNEWRWACECGVSVVIRTSVLGTQTAIQKDTSIRGVALVKRGDLFLVVDSITSRHDGEILSLQDIRERVRRRIEEQTCPINYIRDTMTVAIVKNGVINDDPHGAFEFIDWVPYPEGFDQDSKAQMMVSLFGAKVFGKMDVAGDSVEEVVIDEQGECQASPGKFLRVRFMANLDDYRPVKWPIPYPYWCSGESDTHSVIVAYVPDTNYIREYWPEACNINIMQSDVDIAFSERFAKPDWYNPEQPD